MEKEIKAETDRLPVNMDITAKLYEISELDYIMPKKHNQEYKISRYFEYLFMTEAQLAVLPDASMLFEEHFSDGKVICILKEDKADKDGKVICAELEKNRLNDRRLLFVVSDSVFNQKDNIKRLTAIERLLADAAFMENNRVLRLELEAYKEDVIFEINRFLHDNYDPENADCSVFYSTFNICSPVSSTVTRARQ